jgi:hexosaminidase
VYAVTRPKVSQFGLNTGTFQIVPVGFTDDVLTSGIARYTLLSFPYGPGGKSPLPELVTELLVNVTSTDDVLRLGVDESYTLTVGPGTGGAILTAPTVYGALRGLETFSQLVRYDLGGQTYSAAATVTVDFPRFPYRGVMLDTSRHFISISVMKQVVNMMSAVKLNTLSIHFTDDQSWPLLIPSWPRLAQQSAFSNFSHVYSPADLTEFVAYARLRGVRVLPELDTPSHFSTLFAAYPEYAAVSYDSNNNSYLCMVDPSREETYLFLAGIWADIAKVFPDAEFRIGGDEFQGCWSDSPTVKAWMAAHNFDLSAAYHYYERRLIGIMRALGRRTQAWLDIAGFPGANETWAADYPDVALNVWTGCYSGNWQDDVSSFTAQNGSVVVSGPYYITQMNGAPTTPHFTWQQMYSTDLANFTGNSTAALEHVLGGEICAWDDAAQTDSGDLLVSLTPYMLGVGESFWSPQALTSGVTPDEGRLHQHRCRLVARGFATHPVFAFGTFCPFEYEAPPVMGG